MPADARSAILGRIRRANGASTTLSAAATGWEQIPRDYTQTSPLTAEQTLAFLTERLLDYNAQVVRCARAEAPAAVEAILNELHLVRFVVPPGIPSELLPAGIQLTTDTGLSAAQLDRFDAAITLATLAIAETGTLVLQNLPGQGRRATSLVPDVHLCLVSTRDVVATVPEAFHRLESTSTLPLTFVSGPSATADIEMTRIKGVHGPRFLHVLLLDDGAAT